MHTGQDGTGRNKEDASVPQLWSWGRWYHTALGLRSRHCQLGANLRGTAAF